MKDYSLGAWESLNYTIRYLSTNDKDATLEELKEIKEQLEADMASDFHRKIAIN